MIIGALEMAQMSVSFVGHLRPLHLVIYLFVSVSVCIDIHIDFSTVLLPSLWGDHRRFGDGTNACGMSLCAGCTQG